MYRERLEKNWSRERGGRETRGNGRRELQECPQSYLTRGKGERSSKANIKERERERKVAIKAQREGQHRQKYRRRRKEDSVCTDVETRRGFHQKINYCDTHWKTAYDGLK